MDDFDADQIADAVEDLTILVTAEEAFPAFERLVLNAETEVLCSFRVFDLMTRLHSPEARAIGETWFDLIRNRLDAGVDFHVIVTDFDPIIATDDHRRSWQSARQLAAVNEISDGGKLTFSIALHPARVGLLPRTVLRPKIAKEIRRKKVDPLTPRLAEVDPDGDLPLVPATHHQKLAVIDRTALYIGGLDLNDRRYDTLDHARPAAQTWHDTQVIARGPVVAAAVEHILGFEAVTAEEAEPPAPQPGFLRTLSRRRKLAVASVSPKPVVTEFETAHLTALSQTDGPILLESQFFRHVPFAEALAEAAARKPDLACALILPAAPEDVAFFGNRREDAQLGAQKQMDAIEVLAEGFGPRLALAAPARMADAPEDLEPYQKLHDAPIVYVHSKLSLFGRDRAIVSSANLNGRSFRWDSEAGLLLTRPGHVQALWDRTLAHWMPGAALDPFADPLAFIDTLNAAMAQNIASRPADRTHFLLPYPRGRDITLASPLPGVPDEMV